MPTTASPLPSPSYPSPSTRNPALNPNPHPYAIKTSSSALLSRSNSSGFNTNAARNHYVPLSPTRSRSDSSNGKHRHTKSQYIPEASPSGKAPRPLPTPPAFPTSSVDGYASADEIHAPVPRRARRADTLPSMTAALDDTVTAVTVDDLPSNPKLWTPSELSSYLMTALRVTPQAKSDEEPDIALPARVAKDIAVFVKEMRITGRTFLRLSDEDLKMMGVNGKWREALLLASRNLRQNVLKGRIWGPDLDLDLDNVVSSPSPSSSPSRPLPNPPPFANAMYSSSSSSVDLPNPNGDEERPRRHRNGRVRGMVETFERSGSFSSDGGSMDEGRPRPSLLEEWRQQAQVKRNDQDEAVSISSRSSPEPESPLPADTTFTAESTLTAEDKDDDDPSMEELLAASETTGLDPKRGSWGARAWEEMDLAQGVTVKKIPSDENEVNGFDTVIANGHGSRNGSGKSSGRGTRGRGRVRDERRIVTAIFNPQPPDPAPLLEAVQGVSSPEPSKAAPEGFAPDSDFVRDTQVESGPSDTERVLMVELAETRALVEIFRARLEMVEQKVAVLEERERERERERESLPISVPISEEVSHSARDQECTRCKASDTQSSSSDATSISSSSLLAQASALLPPFVSSLTTARRSRNSVRNDTLQPDSEDTDREPASVSDIPSYVLLVGIGVCAVVLKVMLKKVGGRRP